MCGRLESPAGAPARSSLSSPPDSAGASLPDSAGVSLPPRMGPSGTRGRHAATLALRGWRDSRFTPARALLRESALSSLADSARHCHCHCHCQRESDIP